jgi:hypothetical protein
MTQIRLFIDEDAMDSRLLQALRARGVDVVTVADVNTASFSDEEQLQLSNQLGRVLYTFNAGDFFQLHSIYLETERSHTGIIISTQDYSVGEQMRRLLKLLESKTAEEMLNQVVFLSAFREDV